MIRLLVAATLGLFTSLVGTKYLIRWLTARNIGQSIRDDGPEGHAVKAGTPTMGGIAIVAGGVVGYVVSDWFGGIYTRSGLLVMATFIATGVVGLADDWLSVSRERNLGLNKRTKFGGLTLVAVGFAVLAVFHTPLQTTIDFARPGVPGIEVGKVGWAALSILLILATSNAVNLTDGLDGLAAGASILCLSAYVVIGFWSFRNPEIYDLPHALDMAVVAAAIVGSTLGFLWWNAAPAQIFMGDTGSLALGAVLAVLAVMSDTVLLLPVIGALFVVETLSVILQVARFRLTGKRFFRMAPIHHHFELAGWPETTVIIRFWMMSGLCTALGLGLFYADSISAGLGDEPAPCVGEACDDDAGADESGLRLDDSGLHGTWPSDTGLVDP